MLRLTCFLVVLLLLLPLTCNETKDSKPFYFNFQQSDYKCKPERVEVISYDKNYLEYLTCVTFKYNRTCTAFNTTLKYKVDLGNKMEIIVQAFKFLSNEYRLFPLRFEINLCTIFANDILGVTKFIKCGNFTGCPIYKNRHYYMCNFTPDTSKLPPYIPSGRYMTEVYGLYLSKEIWVARMYAEIYRPIV